MELVMEQEAPAGEVCLTPEAMDAYLDTLRQQGRSADTLAAYRRSIYGLYRSLPPDKRVGRGTLDRWRETLEDQGYLPRTINVRLAAANGLHSVAFCCISTGEFHFPNELAAQIAIETVRDWQRQNPDKIEVIFNVFKDSDCELYKRLLG